MIIRCPSCHTRFDLPASRFDADGTMIKCSSCGHDWIEGRAVEINQDAPSRLPVLAEHAFEPDYEIRRLVSASQEAQEGFAARRRRRRAKVLAWAGLVLALSSPVAFALAFPEMTVKTVPTSMSFYDALGKDVNIYGLAIRSVETQHLIDQGTRVIAIKGEVANISSSSRKIPWLRFGLKDAGETEVYTWQLDTAARPLNPGESTTFVTRIASPPEAAKHVEIRFARIDEIGSKTQP